MQIQLGRNYETRRRSGVPHGSECSLLTHLGVPEKRLIPMPALLNRVCSVTTGKKKARASLASGNVREHAAVWAGSGWQRESAVPRHRQATCPMLIVVRSQNMCRKCFAVFSRSKNFPTHRRGLEKCSLRLVPDIFGVRFVCFANINIARASPSSLLWNTLESCQAFPSAMFIQTHGARHVSPFFSNATVSCRHLFVLLAADNFCNSVLFGVSLRWHRFVIFHVCFLK